MYNDAASSLRLERSTVTRNHANGGEGGLGGSDGELQLVLRGVGGTTAIAAAGMWWLSHLHLHAGYLTGVMLPLMVLSVGLGLTFVPLTLTAVHHLRNEDTGIGSGVLNTMQQVGGALGLSLLATLATQTITDRSKELGQAMADPIVQHQVFTEGATDAHIHDTVLIAAAFAMFNRYVSGLATEVPSDPAFYEVAAGLVVDHGYGAAH